MKTAVNAMKVSARRPKISPGRIIISIVGTVYYSQKCSEIYWI